MTVTKPPKKTGKGKPWPKCDFCGKSSAMMKRGKNGKPVHYCANHWRSRVENTPEFKRKVIASAKAQAELRKPKKRKVKVKR